MYLQIASDNDDDDDDENDNDNTYLWILLDTFLLLKKEQQHIKNIITYLKKKKHN